MVPLVRRVRCVEPPDPVLFFEPKSRYWDKGDVDLDTTVTAADPSDLSSMDRAHVVRAGTDVTIAAYGASVTTALRAAQAAADDGVSVEVVDLRSISPLDAETLVASVRRTGRCVVVHEAPVLYGTGGEIAARVTEECFYHLQAPVLRVGGFHTPYPASKVEHDYLPGVDRVLDAVDRAMAF